MGLKRYKLGDLIEVTRGQSLAGEFYAEEGKYIRLTLGNFDYANGGFKPNTSKTNLYYTGPIKEQFILEEGDIITPLTEQTPGLLGSTARIPISGTYIQSQDVALVRCKDGMINPAFCYYLLPSSSVKKQLAAGAQQTKIRHTSPDKIRDVVVDIPDISEQRRIGQLLDAITHKIELNRSINQNLDALAKQLYDYWFVQFDFPNEEGRPYKSSGGKMVWNDALKRHVPSIWSFKNLKDVACFVKDKVETSKLNLNTYISTENMQPNRGGISIASNLPNTNYVTACNCGDIVIANIRPYFKKIFLIPTNGFGCSSDVLCIRANDPMYSRFVYGTLSDDAFFDYVMSGAKGSKMPRGDKEQIMQYPVIVPNKELVEIFNCVVFPIHSQIHLYRKQAESLTKQRDELLPLLMNGQMSLNSDLSNRGVSGAYSGDTRSAIPVIPVHSVVDLQYRRQN